MAMLLLRVWLLALVLLAIGTHANTNDDDDSGAATCAICLDDLAAPPDNEPTHNTLHNCDHDDRFHAKCIARWVRTMSIDACPMCRKRASLPMTFNRWYATAHSKIRFAAKHFHKADDGRREFERRVITWDLESTLDYFRQSVAMVMLQREYIRESTSFLDKEEDFAIDTEANFARRYKRALGLNKAGQTWRKILRVRELRDMYRDLLYDARRIFEDASNSVTEAPRRRTMSAMFTMHSNYGAVKRVRKAIDMELVAIGDDLLRDASQVLTALLAAERKAGIAE